MRSEESPVTDSQAGTVTISEGLVRLDDDRQSDLRVELRVVDGELSMVSKMAEVGTWPLSSVSISKAGKERFDISIEGETITYFPDDSDTFAAHEVVFGARGRRRRRAKRRRSIQAAAPTTAPTEAAAEEGEEEGAPQATPSATVRETDARSSGGRVEVTPRRKAGPPKDERRRAEKATRAKAREAARTKRAEDRGAARARRAKGREVRRQLRESRGHPVRDRVAATASSLRTRAARRGLIALVRARWRARLALYWAMDGLRQLDGWPFNRIPHVDDEKRREPGHVHAYETSAAPAGLTREVCACGKIRLESKPIELKGPAHLRKKE